MKLFYSLIALALIQGAQAAEAPGFFRVAQDQNQRWWFVDPTGNPFYSTGVNVVAPYGEKEGFTGKRVYEENWEKTMSLSQWVQQTKDRLKEWGFTTLGGWSDPVVFNRHIPYTEVMGCRAHFGDYGKTNPVSRFNWPVMPPADYWDPDFEKMANVAAEQVTQGRADDPMLVGYYLDNEMNWGEEHRTQAHYFDYFFDRPGSFAKAEIMKELQAKYKNIETLNNRWGTQFVSFEELRNGSSLPAFVKSNPDYLEDRSTFLTVAAHRYYSTCTNAIRSRDRNHLLLGERTFGVLSKPEVVKVAGETQDVISVNYYFYAPYAKFFIDRMDPDAISDAHWLQEFNRLSNRPLIISEFGFMDTGLSPFVFGWSHGETGRAKDIAHFIDQTFQAPYLLGYHIFEFSDEPKLGRRDTEDAHMGIVNSENQPYVDVVAAFASQAQKIQAALKQVHLDQPRPLATDSEH